MDPILEFQDVTFGYDRSTAPILREVNFKLLPGRIVSVVGPNGVGKTTLLSLAIGWLSPWRGQIFLDGRPQQQYSRQDRGRWLALVPQTEHTPFDYSVLEYVLMGRSPHMPPLGVPSNKDNKAAWQALEQVGMAEMGDQPVPQLSGGERQLMLLARAVAQEPHLFLLDEPTAHLDLSNKARLIRLLRDLRDQGATLLMTNHEPEIVLALADDVLLIDPGGEGEFGPTGKVFTAEALTRIYQMPIRLVDVDGQRHVSWM